MKVAACHGSHDPLTRRGRALALQQGMSLIGTVSHSCTRHTIWPMPGEGPPRRWRLASRTMAGPSMHCRRVLCHRPAGPSSTAWTSLAYAATPAQEMGSIMTTVDWRTPVLFASTVMDDVCQPTRRGRATRRRASPLRPGRPVAAATPAIRGSTSRPESPPQAGLPARWPGPCHRRPGAA